MNPVFDPLHIHPSIKGGLERWADHGIRPGSFLISVLENDLFGAYQAADSDNLYALPSIVYYIRNYLPSLCYGSPGRMREWEQRFGRG